MDKSYMMWLEIVFVLMLWYTEHELTYCAETNITIAAIVQGNIWPDAYSGMVNTTFRAGGLTMTIINIAESNFQKIINKVCILMTENVHGFIFYSDCNTARILDKMALFAHLPSIVMTRDLCDKESDHMIQLQPSCQNSNALIADLASNRGSPWSNVMLFFDQTLNQRCMTDLIRKLSLNPTSTRLVNINNYHSAEAYLGFLIKYHPDAVIMVASKENIETTLNEAAKMTDINYQWILLTGDSDLPRLNDSLLGDEFVLFIKHASGEDAMSSCNESLDYSVEESTHYERANLWMFDFYSKHVTSEHVSSLEPLTCHLSSKVPYRDDVFNLSKQHNTQDVEYQLCSVISEERGWVHQGAWSQRTGLSLTDDKIFANEFVDFGHATLKVATVELRPFVNVDTDIKNNTIYSGFCIDMLDELASRFKFRYELVAPADSAFGSLNEDGSWTGMVGMTQRKEVDFAVGPFTITSVRDQVIDFTTTIMELGVGILTKRPHSEANKEYKVFKPLTVEVWGLIGVAIVLVGIMFYFVNKLSPYSNVELKNKNAENAESKLDLNTSFWLTYGAFLEQGGAEYKTKSWSGRVMLSFWWIFTILMLATYTAQLAAYLTVSIIESPINSLDELADQDEIKPLFLYGSNLKELFETGTSSTYRKILDKMSDMPRVPFDRFDLALEYVKSGKYAFMTDDSVLEYVMIQDCTTFALAEEIFNNAGLGFVLQENSKYLKAFNFAIMKMAEGGFIERWKKKWWPQSDSCTTTNVAGSAHSLDMDSLLGLFYVYLGAIGISTVVFVIEVICRTKHVGKIRNKLADRLRMLRGNLRGRRVNTHNFKDTVTTTKQL